MTTTTRRRRCRDADRVSRAVGAPQRPVRLRSACAAPAVTTPARAASPPAGHSNDDAGASSRPLRTTAIRSLSTPRPTKSRADGSDTVTYWLRRCSFGDNHDSTNQPSRLKNRAGHRPLLAMAVVHQHRDPPAVDQPGQERQAVLGVDDHIRSHPSAAVRYPAGPPPSPAAPTRRPSTARPRDGSARRRRLRGAPRRGSARSAA